ncbi:MAG: hypothetical protein E6Q40_05320 [Cupriavidus sp.]|nr:MAG: hypothetical protein E6Q40_05320 [Cupriavidus sp.]
MTDEEWEALCNAVADQMKIHTRPFVTPLIQDVEGKPPENGTGTYIDHDGPCVLTCDHVAVHAPFLHQFYPHQDLIPLPVTWKGDPMPVDASLAAIPSSHWTSRQHLSKPLGMDRFAPVHRPVERELLFFRGVAGENVVVGANHSRVISTGYCSQELPGSGDTNIFEILWNPAKTRVTEGTDDEVAKVFKHHDPHGFSGSLVWNTRFVEKGFDLSTWRPQDAQVTGLLRRLDEDTDTLLAWRVEHLLTWLAKQ